MNPRCIILITVVSTLISCNKTAKEGKVNEAELSENVDNSEEFLGLFENIQPRGLHLYAPSWDRRGNVVETFLEGQSIDVNKFSFTDNSEIFFNIEYCKKGFSKIHAIGRFEIDSNYLGLVIRQHSQYNESLIELVLWDKQTRTIHKGLELADSFGDGGWHFDTESWVVKHRPTGLLEIVTRRKDRDFDDDHEILTISDSIWSHAYTRVGFVKSTMDLGDTTPFKLKRWR